MPENVDCKLCKESGAPGASTERFSLLVTLGFAAPPPEPVADTSGGVSSTSDDNDAKRSSNGTDRDARGSANISEPAIAFARVLVACETQKVCLRDKYIASQCQVDANRGRALTWHSRRRVGIERLVYLRNARPQLHFSHPTPFVIRLNKNASALSTDKFALRKVYGVFSRSGPQMTVCTQLAHSALHKVIAVWVVDRPRIPRVLRVRAIIDSRYPVYTKHSGRQSICKMPRGLTPFSCLRTAGTR